MASIGGQLGFIAEPDHVDLLAPAQQVDRRLQAVAAVVARPGRHPHAPRVRGQRQGQPCHRQTRALHQRVRRQDSHRLGFDQTGGRCVVQRLGAGQAGDALHVRNAAAGLDESTYE